MVELFSFFPLFGVCSVLAAGEYVSVDKKKKEDRLIKVSVLQEPNIELEISLRPMEYLEEEQQSQQPLERNLNAYKSMRDYRNPPWMSVPSCMVPPTNTPYGNSYKPSWRNHLNLSWGPEPTQYAPPPYPQYASTPQPQPPQSISPVELAILDLTKLVGDFVEKQKTINAQLS